MSAPTGSAASSLIDERPDDRDSKAAGSRRPRSTHHLQQLELRREAAAIRRQTVYGLVMGWVLVLVGGFVFCCVPSRVDWLWQTMFFIGLAHLIAAVVLPQALAWPERAWIAVFAVAGLAHDDDPADNRLFRTHLAGEFFRSQAYRGLRQLE